MRIEPGTALGDRYEVRDVLGKGGFGIVYLVSVRDADEVFAFKTLRPEHHGNDRLWSRFRQEAQVWLDLGYHPNLVEAHFVEEIDGVLYLAIDYVAPDVRGIHSLEGVLQGGPAPVDRCLRWTIQCCRGMEFAYARGLHSHRDIKPSNILIDHGHTIRITDLGLARATGVKDQFAEVNLATYSDELDLMAFTAAGQRLGTPAYMSPEQFRAPEWCDERSDLYSYGVMLFQLATGGRLPFAARPPERHDPADWQRYLTEMERMHHEDPPPTLASPLGALVDRCLAKAPSNRYPSFQALRIEAEKLLYDLVGEREPPPRILPEDPRRLVERGYSFLRLREFDRAARCFESAIRHDDRDVAAWNGRGLVYHARGRYRDALACLDAASELDPQNVEAWINRGDCLQALGEHTEAIAAYEKALELDWHSLGALNNLGNSLYAVQEFTRALTCYETAVLLDEQQPAYLVNQAFALMQLQRFGDARDSLDRAIALNPSFATAWCARGLLANLQGRFNEALPPLEQALRLDPGHAAAWIGKGNVRLFSGDAAAAAACYRRGAESAPDLPGPWTNAGIAYYREGDLRSAARCFKTATRLAPADSLAWYNLGIYELLQHRSDEALRALRRAARVEPAAAPAWYSLGLLLHRAEQWEEAQACYQTASNLGFRPPVLAFNQGLALVRLQRIAEAAECFADVVRQQPSDEAAQAALSACRRHLNPAVERRRFRRRQVEADGPTLAELTTEPRRRPQPTFRPYRPTTPLSFRAFPAPAPPPPTARPERIV